MSETVLRIRLDELHTIRVACQAVNCPGVVEMPLPSTANVLGSFTCPFCRSKILHTDDNHLIRLAQHIQALNETSVKIEFVIPQ